MDKLTEIMRLQGELQQRLGTDFDNMSDEARAAFMRNHRGYLEDELAEALYEMPNYKLWKNYDAMSEEDRIGAWQKVKMELVDSLHFFVNLLLCSGFTADEVYEMYTAKNKENHRRQDDGYTADKSYREQGVDEVIKSRCTVTTPNGVRSSNSYVALTVDENGAASLNMNIDLFNMGLLAKVMTDMYEKRLYELSLAEQIALDEDIMKAFEEGFGASDE